MGSGLILVSSLMYALYLVGSGQMIRIPVCRAGNARIDGCNPNPLCHYPAAFVTATAVTDLCDRGGDEPVFDGLAGVCLSLAIRYIGAGRAALIGCVGPLLTIFFGYWLLDEGITPIQVIGALLVIAGVLVVGRR